MKRLALATLVVCGVSIAAPSLSARKKDIDAELRRLNDDKKALIKTCADLRSDIPAFNTDNNAANSDLRQKRDDKVLSDDAVKNAGDAVDDLNDAYVGLLGQIRAKKTELKHLKGNYLQELRNSRTTVAKDYAKAVSDKNAQERKTQDLDNFRNEDEYLAAIGEFYRLKGIADGLEGELNELDQAIRAGVPPTEAGLKDQIKDLENQAGADYIVLTNAIKGLNDLKTANKTLAAEIKKLETGKGALSNFVVPEVCDHF